MDKVVIIGAGVAGLSAGIFLKQNGIDAEIYEKQHTAGGLCSSWNRNGFIIDNCIHWLTLGEKGSTLYEMWRNVGVITDEDLMFNQESFYSVEMNNQRLTLWFDLERTQQELIDLSPEDTSEIKKFIDLVKLAQEWVMPTSEEEFIHAPFQTQYIIYRIMREYGQVTVRDVSERFRHPLIKELFLCKYLSEGSIVFTFIYFYAMTSLKENGIPWYGSRGLSHRMVERFQNLGGKIFYRSPVTEIIIEDGNSSGIRLLDNSIVYADYIIAACDLYHVFHQLMKPKYMSEMLRIAFNDQENYPVECSFHVAYSVDGIFEEVEETLMLQCDPIIIANSTQTWLKIKNYLGYDPEYHKKNITVLQVCVPQFSEDYKYWEKLHENKEKYNAVKQHYANIILGEILKKFPIYNGKIKVLDTWTPITFKKHCNVYQGAYTGFNPSKLAKMFFIPSAVEGLDNVFIANQWQSNPGGLPVALVVGKCVSDKIIDIIKK